MALDRSPLSVPTPGDPGQEHLWILHPEDRLRRKNYLRILNRAWLVFGGVALVTAPLYTYWQLSLVIAFATAVTFVAVALLLRANRLPTASITFCACVNTSFFAVFLVLAALLGPDEAFRIEAPVLMLMGLTALFAAALLGPRAALAVAALNSLILVGTRLVLSPSSIPRPSVLVFFWLLAAVAFLYENTLNGAFAELRGVRDGLEANVIKRTAELRNSISQLERVTQELLAANRDLDLFNTAVAHDLRNPLIVIEGYSRVLQQGTSNPEVDVAFAVDKMLAAESRMHRLIDGLLAFARLGQHALRIEKVAMQALGERLAAEFKDQEKSRCIEIAISNLPDCEADPFLMEQILANLIGNAVKFTRTRENAKIQIEGSRLNEELIYSVRDNGVGFALDSAPRLFSPMQRFHAQSEFEGTGIGLAIVDRMVRLLGGRVWAESEPDRGATFYFALSTPS
jgi:signal transduction histidine kinase